MKNAVTLFSELGCRLATFGREPQSQRVIAEACAANGWFAADEVRCAVEALHREMLVGERLAEWLAAYGVPVAQPRNVLVVMAGNIPLVGFFDMLCVISAGHHCLVKPSTKDRILMEYVMALLRDIDPSVRLSLHDEADRVDAVIATGSDNANRYFRARYGSVPSLLRGNRHSVAVLSGHETEEQLAALANDIWAYSGLGCRNVSMIFAPEGCDVRLTPPRLNPKYINNYRQQRALAELNGIPYRDLGAALLVEGDDFSNALSVITCARYRTLHEVTAWLSAHAHTLQCVVSECLAPSAAVGSANASGAVGSANASDVVGSANASDVVGSADSFGDFGLFDCVAFGRAQSPSLTDYPDRTDVMAFLAGV